MSACAPRQHAGAEAVQFRHRHGSGKVQESYASEIAAALPVKVIAPPPQGTAAVTAFRRRRHDGERDPLLLLVAAAPNSGAARSVFEGDASSMAEAVGGGGSLFAGPANVQVTPVRPLTPQLGGCGHGGGEDKAAPTTPRTMLTAHASARAAWSGKKVHRRHDTGVEERKEENATSTQQALAAKTAAHAEAVAGAAVEGDRRFVQTTTPSTFFCSSSTELTEEFDLSDGSDAGGHGGGSCGKGGGGSSFEPSSCEFDGPVDSDFDSYFGAFSGDDKNGGRGRGYLRSAALKDEGTSHEKPPHSPLQGLSSRSVVLRSSRSRSSSGSRSASRGKRMVPRIPSGPRSASGPRRPSRGPRAGPKCSSASRTRVCSRRIAALTAEQEHEPEPECEPVPPKSPPPSSGARRARRARWCLDSSDSSVPGAGASS